MSSQTILAEEQVGPVLEQALDAGEGLLRLTPTWVPRSFLHPGKRIKLHPDEYYSCGAHRGGIDDEVFIIHEAANRGVEIENTGTEPLESLRYFGPDTFSEVPNVGDYRNA